MGDFYVGTSKLPFKMVLGRLQQRANGVCIDERENGTYIVIKDERWKPVYEKLVETADKVSAREVC